MKWINVIAAGALIVAPTLVSAQSTTGTESSQDQNQGAVTPGGTSQGALPVFGAGSIPAGAIVVGGVVILAGVVIGVVAATDGDGGSTTSTTSTN